MDLRTSALIACLAWAAGATVAAVGLLVYVSNQPDRAEVESFAASQRGAASVPTTVENQLSRQAQIARELSSQVSGLEGSLRQYRDRLQSAREEVQQLRREANQSIDLAIDLLEQSRTEPRLGAAPDALGPMPEAPVPPAGNVETVTADEGESEADMLRQQLEQRDEQIATLELEHEESLARLLTHDLALRDESARILVRLGPEAAAEVAESLRHPDPEVRIWAANVLRKMGAIANATLGDLTIASKDEDPRVQAAVNEAIKAVAD